jgi:AraC family transcriptional regulator
MSSPRLRDIPQNQQDATPAQLHDLPIGEQRPHADEEMTRVLKMAPLRMASDPSSGVITFWRHDPCTTSSSPWSIMSSWLFQPSRFGSNAATEKRF